MIASVFRKSTPINYLFVLLATLFFYFFYVMNHGTAEMTLVEITKKGVGIVMFLASLFVVNFIIKKNGLSKDSTYTVFFYLLLVLFFPKVLENIRLFAANFFVLLGLRRLISLQSLKAPKEKIFDASLWIFLAAIFHYWCILFIILVFVSIIFHVSSDYRNWILPFIAFLTVAILFIVTALIFDKNWIDLFLQNATIDMRIEYFQSVYENISLSLYATVALFFVVSFFSTLSNRPMILQASYKKVIMWFVLGIVIYVLSPQKSNDVLIFTFAPLAMMATFHIETAQIKWQKEVVVYFLVGLSLFSYFSQL